ncbi:sugar ABC transporter substrate-binding protein [Paenibacillus montaniterrae]|uniref:Sugar ABC transporter substrate-binding protein n=1 Tax=Paenibacillus montaniterrae TaxID=429341 RepID=A0A919YKG8_9BACL|nr:sugar ABC transporter substrate-binding protein [Paenibacillus montaniterrae]GIP15553.1 sugar ABC transporter substrate-binding protein [Paenibacillus montaniterrae]
MKKWSLLVCIVLSLALVSACSSGGNANTAPNSQGTGTSNANSNSNGSDTPAEVELRMMWWGDQERADITNQVVELFEAKYPHIDIIGEFAPSSGYWDKINTQLASGTAPDIFFLGGNVVDYAIKGVLLPLDEYVGNQLDLSDMDESMIQYGTVNDQLLHISAGANARGIVINKTMFEKANMEIPQDGWTWEEYAAIATEISDKLGDGVYGTYDFTYDGLDIYFKQHGQQLYNMDEQTIGFDQDMAMQWFSYWAELAEKGGVVTPEAAVSNPNEDISKNLMITSQVAMTLLPSNQLTSLQSLTTDELTMVQLPRGPKGTGVVFESSQGLSGYAKTEHPEEVALFISFFINDPEAARILGNNRGVPVTAANRDVLQAEASDVEKIIYDYTSRVSEATKTEPFAISYNLPGNAEFEKMAKTTIQEIGFGRKTVEEAVASFYANAQEIIANNVAQ